MISVGENILQEMVESFKKVNFHESSPFAVLRKRTAVITNGHVLMEWPVTQVDTDCKTFKTLLKVDSTYKQRLIDKNWVDLIAADDANYYPIARVKQTKKEQEEDDPTYTYAWDDHRVTFKQTYVDMLLDACVGDVEIAGYAIDVPIGMEVVKLANMIVIEDGKKVGAVAPCHVKPTR